MRLAANTLCIEVTRRCNLQCAHCLRGEAEDVRMDKKTLTAILPQFSYISSIVFTGGEPSLNIAAIENALEICKENGVEVGSFYIVTNGNMEQWVLNRLIRILNRWYEYCSDKERCGLTISRDKFHGKTPWTFYEIEERCLPYFWPEDKTYDFDNGFLVNDGRAKNLSGYQKKKSSFVGTWSDFEVDAYRGEPSIVDGVLYLSCDSLFYPDCDLSYDTMRNSPGLTIEKLKSFLAEKLSEQIKEVG